MIQTRLLILTAVLMLGGGLALAASLPTCTCCGRGRP